ncbi:MAG: tetratricopeptide repeat protein [Pseudomonadota bacterium]
MLGRLRAWILANYSFVLVALITVSYLPVFGAGFVWDDDENIVQSPNLHDLAGLERIWGDPSSTQQYYPLTHTSFWVQVKTTGLWPLPFHIVNVALHVTTALLVLFVLRRLAVAGAEFAAALFALHPLNVESVAWVTERKNVLSGALALAACLCYLRYDELSFSTPNGSAARGRQKRWSWCLAFGLFLLALGAKTAVAPVPAALLVLLVGLRGRPSTRTAIALAPFFAVGVVAGLATAFLERTHVHAQGADFAWSWAERLLIAGRAFCFYPQKLLLPEGLIFFYPKWQIDVHAALGWCFPLAVVALFVTLTAMRRRLGNGPLLAFLVYGLLVFPALGFFNVYFMRFAFVQNHFQYLAGIPVLAAVAAAGSRGLAHATDTARFSIAAALTVSCGVYTFAESRAFHSYETLFLTTLERNPEAWVAAYNLGVHYQDAGDRRGAIEMYRRAQRIRPEDPQVVMSLGTALAEAGRLPEALSALQEAVRLRPEHAETRLNLAVALDLAGQPAAAVAAYAEALRLRPKYTRAKRQEAWLLATTSDTRVRDGQAAIALARSACAETVRAIARCQDTLAAAEAANGDFESAATRAQHAAQLARSEGDESATKAYQARARLYATHQAYVDQRHGLERDERPMQR